VSAASLDLIPQALGEYGLADDQTGASRAALEKSRGAGLQIGYRLLRRHHNAR
jgi:hypothetical protein